MKPHSRSSGRHGSGRLTDGEKLHRNGRSHASATGHTGRNGNGRGSHEQLLQTPNYYKYQHRNPILRWHVERFHDKIAGLIESTGARSVFEAGCGEGFLIRGLKRRLPHVRFTGMDLRPEAVQFARGHFAEHGRFIQGSVYDMPKEAGEHDLLLNSQVLEHLDDPETAIDQLAATANKHLLITVPLEPVFRCLNALFMAFRLGPPPGHVQFWGPLGLRRLVRPHMRIDRHRLHLSHQLLLGRVHGHGNHPG